MPIWEQPARTTSTPWRRGQSQSLIRADEPSEEKSPSSRIFSALLALAAMGALYQAWSVRREAVRFPPPGRLVDVGGRRVVRSGSPGGDHGGGRSAARAHGQLHGRLRQRAIGFRVRIEKGK